MPTIGIPFGPTSDAARAADVGQPTLINCFAEASTQGKSPFALYSDPGLVAFATFPGGETTIRGVWTVGTQLYAVADERLYSISPVGVPTFIGNVLGTGTVITATNRKATPQTAIIADSHCYILESGVLTEIADPDLPANVHSCDYMDGYTIYGIRDGRFFISALDDAGNIDALDFTTAEGSPGAGVRVKVFGRELWYFKTDAVEIYQNTGNASFPFEKLGGGFLSRGLFGKITPAAFDNSIVWVASNGLVVRGDNYVPRRISNHAVERDIQTTINAGLADTMEGFVYQEGGHEFYQLSSSTWTWVYDAATDRKSVV